MALSASVIVNRHLFILDFNITDVLYFSKHGRVDAGFSGVRDAAWLVLLHWGGSQLWGSALTGSKLRSVHWGLPASSRFVKETPHVKINTSVFGPSKPDSVIVVCFSYFSEVGWSRQVQREHDQTVLISSPPQGQLWRWCWVWIGSKEECPMQTLS